MRSLSGKDGVDCSMLKNLESIPSLLDVFNITWTSFTILTTWREYQVCFIDKVDKNKVTLSSCMRKMFERIVNEILWWVENKLIHNLQNSYRRGRSCVYNLVKITSDIRKTILQGKNILTVFLDVSSAYDNIQFHIGTILGRLSAFPVCITSWYPDTRSFHGISGQ